MSVRRFLPALLAVLSPVAAAFAWNSHGHATITYLALDTLPASAPSWLTSEAARRIAAFQASEADRWKGTRSVYIGHENRPDHYLDIELLDQYDLTVETLPKFRYEYVALMAVARHEHPEQVDPYDPEEDWDRSHEWPGFLPYAILEHYTKLRSSFHTARVLEEIDDPRRARHLEAARDNALFHMGMLSHFVGDAAQPLHTTKHYNGWVGPNPKGYTTSRSIHSYIDGGVLRHHGLDYQSLKDEMGPRRTIADAHDPWGDVLTHIERSFKQVEPLYRLERDEELKEEEGEEFIANRLLDGAAMLGGLYWAAWEKAEPKADDVETYLRYTGALSPNSDGERAAAP